jgi:hypothetical protein
MARLKNSRSPDAAQRVALAKRCAAEPGSRFACDSKKPGSRFCDAPLKKRCIAPGHDDYAAAGTRRLGDPALEINKRTGAERLLLGDGLFIAAQPRRRAFGLAAIEQQPRGAEKMRHLPL